MIPIKITTANTPGQMRVVHELTYMAYRAKGLCQADPSERLQHYPHLDYIAETTVLMAMAGDKLVGTVSITLDGPEGLHVDEDFPEVMVRWRPGGLRLAAAWRIVTDPAYRGDRRIITGLMRAGFVEAIARGAGLLFCSFHLGFLTVGRGVCRALNGAEAVLMMYDVEHNGIPEQLRWDEK